MFKVKSNKKQNVSNKTSFVKYFCINRGRQIALEVTYPDSIEKYKIHEVFNKECIGSKFDLVAEPFHITGFNELSQKYGQISFQVVEVKKNNESV